MIKQEADDETNNARKRSNHDGDDNNSDHAPQKKSFMSDAEAVYLKFLVPQATAGSVIGKGGANISELQKEYNVHIRMSKANDVFPGTDSRVALMSGGVSDVLAATILIFKRMTSPSDLFPRNPRPKTISDKEISLIVPQTTAGLIIGKGGSRVKSIQEESQCHINLTQKSEQLPSNERVVTIQNNNSKVDHIETALRLILDTIKLDPSSGSCLMINYSASDTERHGGGGGGGGGMHHGHGSRRDDYHDDYYDDRPPRRHWDNKGSGRGDMMGMGRAGRGDDAAPVSAGSNGGTFSTTNFPPQVHFWCTFSGPAIANGHTPPAHMLEGMKAYLLNVGYPPKATQEIIAASNILASYGVLKPGNIAIFNTTQLQSQATNPFNTMAGNGNGSDSIMNAGGYNNMGGGGNLNEGWNNNQALGGGGVGGMFINKFQQGGGLNRGGYDSGHGMGGGGGPSGGMGGGGGYGKNDMHDIKRRY